MPRKKVVKIDDLIPIPSNPIDHTHLFDGSVFRIKGYMRTGKTLLAVAIIDELVSAGMFKAPEQIISNVTLYNHKVKQVSNSEIKHFIATLASLNRLNMICLADEADQIWSHATTDRTQRELCLPIWQALKQSDYIFLIQHEGLGIDLVLRLASLITLDVQYYDKTADEIVFDLIDRQYGNYETGLTLANASKYFSHYNTYESHW